MITIHHRATLESINIFVIFEIVLKKDCWSRRRSVFQSVSQQINCSDMSMACLSAVVA